MSDEDARLSGGGLHEEDRMCPITETEVETMAISPGGCGSSNTQQVDQEGDQGLHPSSGHPASPVCTSPFGHGRTQLLDIHKGRPIRLQVRVLVPIKDHPNYNFVGKLLGPKGNSLKQLQEESQTKMAILGRGSMRDRAKEEELRATGDPKHGHLQDDLHVEITAFAPASEAYARMAHALAEVKRFLVPDYYDDIRQNQLRELAVMNGNRKRGRKGTPPDGTEFDSPAVGSQQQQDSNRQTPFSPQQQQRIQLPMNGSSQHPTQPGQPVGSRAIRCGMVPGPGLVARSVRVSPHRGGGSAGLVRSFVTSVCGGGPAPSLFREVTMASQSPGAEATRIKYLTQEEAFTFEEDFEDLQRPDEVSLRSSQPFIGQEYRDDDDDADGMYDTHNGYTGKDFFGEDWSLPKGSSASSSTVPPLRVGPSVGRLKTIPAPPTSVRPPRSVYREHPYFPAAVARY